MVLTGLDRTGPILYAVECRNLFEMCKEFRRNGMRQRDRWNEGSEGESPRALNTKITKSKRSHTQTKHILRPQKPIAYCFISISITCASLLNQLIKSKPEVTSIYVTNFWSGVFNRISVCHSQICDQI